METIGVISFNWIMGNVTAQDTVVFLPEDSVTRDVGCFA